MKVKCLHYSANYPDGGQRVGDFFDLTKLQAKYYEDIGWVKILHRRFQTIGKRGRFQKNNTLKDLSSGYHYERAK